MKEIKLDAGNQSSDPSANGEQAELMATYAPRYENVRIYLQRHHGPEDSWPAYHNPTHGLLVENRTTLERAIDLLSLAASTGLPYGFEKAQKAQEEVPPLWHRAAYIYDHEGRLFSLEETQRLLEQRFLGIPLDPRFRVDEVTDKAAHYEASLREVLESDLNERGAEAQREYMKVASLLLGFGDPRVDETTEEEEQQVQTRLLERGILWLYPSAISEQISKMQRQWKEEARQARHREGEIRIGDRTIAVREGFVHSRYKGGVLFVLNPGDTKLPYHSTDAEFLELSRVNWYHTRDPQAQPITDLLKQALMDQYRATFVEEQKGAYGAYTKAVFAPKPFAVLSVDISAANRQYTLKLLIANSGPENKTGFLRENMRNWPSLQKEMEKILKSLFAAMEKEGITEVGMDSLSKEASVPAEIFFRALARVIAKRHGALPGDHLVIYCDILPDFEEMSAILEQSSTIRK